MSEKTPASKAQVETVTLKQLCSELKVSPREARERLRLAVRDRFTASAVTDILTRYLLPERKEPLPDNIQEFLLMPIMDQLQSEMQDVCSADCRRMMSLGRRRLVEGGDEVDDYWIRLESEGIDEPEKKHLLRIESDTEPCKVGFDVGPDKRCPLFAMEPKASNTGELLAIIERVVTFRKAQARSDRAAKERLSGAQKPKA
jgi:hypothetical protein